MKARIVNQDTIIRYDSGHSNHKSFPHLNDAKWPIAHLVHAPTIDVAQPVTLYGFAMQVEEWREAHHARLPDDPPNLARARRRR